jgi:L-ribulose-5-phosphate 3-epimerase
MNRKNFIRSATLLAGASFISAAPVTAAIPQAKPSEKITLKKGLGFGMIKEDLPLTDKFKLIKDLGFDGVEMNSPVELNNSEFLDAKERSGIELPSVVNKDHWQMPLSDPNPKVREQIIKSVATSLQEAKEFGGDTVLVVPGVVNEKVSYEQAYITAMNSIRELIPYAENRT